MAGGSIYFLPNISCISFISTHIYCKQNMVSSQPQPNKNSQMTNFFISVCFVSPRNYISLNGMKQRKRNLDPFGITKIFYEAMAKVNSLSQECSDYTTTTTTAVARLDTDPCGSTSCRGNGAMEQGVRVVNIS